jgi:uncharacterized protein
MAKNNESSDTPRQMSVREAGRKGGETTARRHGPEFYEEIGRKGAARVKELIARGKRQEK